MGDRITEVFATPYRRLQLMSEVDPEISFAVFHLKNSLFLGVRTEVDMSTKLVIHSVVISPPYPMFRLWRAIQLLDRLPGVIELLDLTNALEAVQRSHAIPCISEVESMINRVGRKAHDEIMTMKVPHNIVEIIISLMEAGEQISRSDITLEVSAGTTPWRTVYPEFGMMRPPVSPARLQETLVLTRSFEATMLRYLVHRGFDWSSELARFLRAHLIVALERNDLAQQDKDFIFGIAAVLAEEEFAAYMRGMGHGGTRIHRTTEAETQTRVVSVAEWLMGEFQKGHLRKQPLHSLGEYKNTLTRMHWTWYDQL